MKLPNLTGVRKAAVSVVGLAALLISAGVLHGEAQSIVGWVLAAGTAAGVYIVPNQTAKPPAP